MQFHSKNFISNHIKSNDTGQDPDGRTDEDVPWKVDAADDARAGQRRAEDEQDDAQPRHNPEKGHGDDKDGKDVPAGHRFSLRVLVDDGVDVQHLIGALKVQRPAHQRQRRKGDGGHQQ